MKVSRFTLMTDGTSDGKILIPILEWLLRQHCQNIGIKVDYADLSRGRDKPRHLVRKVALAVARFPCECLFIHRDAEKKESADDRRKEIQGAIESLGDERPTIHICVVPIRMSEAWLLFDEAAIRRAAGNPHGTIPLTIPRLADLETVTDPKQILYDLLTTATEFTGRRKKSFDPKIGFRQISQMLTDFTPLRQLSAFQALERDVRQIVQEKRWNAVESED